MHPVRPPGGAPESSYKVFVCATMWSTLKNVDSADRV